MTLSTRGQKKRQALITNSGVAEGLPLFFDPALQGVQAGDTIGATDSLAEWIPGHEVKRVQVRGVCWPASLGQKLSPHALEHTSLG